jgi:uncharacterized protein (TIGR03437 family)
MRMPTVLLLAAMAATGQKPVIFPGGVVNAASYLPAMRPTGVVQRSIASIFGQNLATATLSASGTPLPTVLGGTSVTVAGRPAPLFFVSPGQINLQVPLLPSPLGSNRPEIVVSTSAGSSEPYPIELLGPNFGIFTLDGSGCGRGAVLNVARDGSVSLNSPSNSASPGDYLTIYGTGFSGILDVDVPDGRPAPSNPPASYDYTTVNASSASFGPFPSANYQAAFGTQPTGYISTRPSFAGRAPGLVGVDQLNFQIPENVTEGCTVPVTVNYSQPVPVSIRRGGGPCVDPPLASFGQLTWERTVATGTDTAGETETFTATLTAAPELQAPLPVASNTGQRYAGTCPLVGHRRLDGGTVTLQGPGLAPLPAVPAVANGLAVLRATLPRGTIRPGLFQVKAAGGAEVGSFETSVRIGSGINVTTPLPAGTRILRSPPPIISWTGGDANTWVTIWVVQHQQSLDKFFFERVRASTGRITIPVIQSGPYLYLPGVATGPADIVLEVTPDPSDEPPISAPGLSLGGKHTWKYSYRFGGLTIE